MSQKGMVPSIFHKLHATHGTPHNSIIFICTLTVTTIFFPFDPLLEVATFCSGVSYALEFLSFYQLRIIDPAQRRPFCVPGGLLGAGALILLPVTMCMATCMLSTAMTMGITVAYAIAAMTYYHFWAEVHMIQGEAVPQDEASIKT